jgi:hypothetical protein
LFDSAENETDDYPDELNASFIENFGDTYTDEDPPTQPDSLLASPSTSSNTAKKLKKTIAFTSNKKWNKNIFFRMFFFKFQGVHWSHRSKKIKSEKSVAHWCHCCPMVSLTVNKFQNDDEIFVRAKKFYY